MDLITANEDVKQSIHGWNYCICKKKKILLPFLELPFVYKKKWERKYINILLISGYNILCLEG